MEQKDLEALATNTAFTVVYARIIDNKKKGLEFEGPFLGPECESLDQAHQECRDLVTGSKDIILVKNYCMSEHTYETAVEHAKDHFGKIFDQMESAAGLCDRPARKRKKKSKK